MKSYLSTLINAGAEIYEVGGPVRDGLMGRDAKDQDYLVRHLTVAQIRDTLKPFGQITMVGRSFGVIKFTPFREKHLTIDIALPRREISTGEGHRDFDVDFDPELSVEEDLSRRDFTINAMAKDITSGNFIDPFNGRDDLEKRLLRQVFDRAFIEDPLRLMRGIQFAARLDLTIEEATWQAMCEHARLITTVSAERIAEEVRKLLSARTPSRGFRLMRDCGLLAHIFPELAAITGIGQDKQPGEDVFDHTMRVLDATRGDDAIENAGDLDLMAAALFHDIGKAQTARYHEPSKRVVFFSHQIASKRMARRALERIKASTIGIDVPRVCSLIDHHMFETKAFFTDRAIRRFVAKVGTDLIFQLLDLRLADNRGGKHPSATGGVVKLRKRIREEMERKPPFGAKDLAVNGHDLMQAGIPAGPEMGSLIRRMLDLVIDTPELNTKEQLLALVPNMRESGDPS